MSAKIYQLHAEKKVINIFSEISHIWHRYLEKQDEIKRFKLRILEGKAYQFYYDMYLVKEILRTKGTVDIPPSTKAQAQAKEEAKKLVLSIEKMNKVDYFFKILRTKGIRKCLRLQK